MKKPKVRITRKRKPAKKSKAWFKAKIALERGESITAGVPDLIQHRETPPL